MNASEWNPRYLAYCRSQGRTPDAQIAHDAIRWPGGRMAGFLTWSPTSEQPVLFPIAAVSDIKKRTGS